MKGRVGFHGNLGIQVIRANPTRWQRVMDALATLLGRRSA